MHSARLKPTKLISVGPRTTYQAPGSLGCARYRTENGIPEGRREGGGVLMIMHDRSRICPWTLASLQCRDEARKVFTDQAGGVSYESVYREVCCALRYRYKELKPSTGEIIHRVPLDAVLLRGLNLFGISPREDPKPNNLENHLITPAPVLRVPFHVKYHQNSSSSIHSSARLNFGEAGCVLHPPLMYRAVRRYDSSTMSIVGLQ